MVKWVVWSFLISMQQWAHLIVFIRPVIQMDLGARSQQFIVVVTTKTLPDSSDCSSSCCLPKRLAKWGKRCVWDPSSIAISWVFYLYCTFLSSSAALKLQLLYGDWYFHATSLFFEEFITAMSVFQKRFFLAYLLNAQHGETLQSEAAVGNSSWLLILCPFYSLGKSRILCGPHWPTQLVCSTQLNDLVAISLLFSCSAAFTLWQILSV